MITADVSSLVDSFAEDVDRGLTDSPKHLSCVYFYDYKGSLFFEQICRLPEYYITRAEAQILEAHSAEIISYAPEDALLVEMGSGSCNKTRHIIEALLAQYDRVTYSPIDVSRKMLKQSAGALLERYADLEIISVAAEYGEGLRQLEMRTDQPKFLVWLGSSIGNFELTEGIRFLKTVVGWLSRDDFFLIGFDLEKDSEILETAYNDSKGVTARFNLNLLARINRELGGEFDLDRFAHLAIYNEERRRIEMYLASTCEQHVAVTDLHRTYHFKEGERVHTENSHKYSLDTIKTMADQVGMEIVRQWFDPKRYFNLTLFRPHGR
jgi:dimethylhistidine N-methyltransferase